MSRKGWMLMNLFPVLLGALLLLHYQFSCPQAKNKIWTFGYGKQGIERHGLMTSGEHPKAIWVQPKNHILVQNSVHHMPRHKLNLLLHQSAQVIQGNGLLWNSADFNPEAERSWGREEVIKIQVSQIQGSTMMWRNDSFWSQYLLFLWFQKHLGARM